MIDMVVLMFFEYAYLSIVEDGVERYAMTTFATVEGLCPFLDSTTFRYLVLRLFYPKAISTSTRRVNALLYLL